MPIVEERLHRHRMSWEDYLALPDDVRAEWVDGEVVVSPRASLKHGGIVSRVVALLVEALPDLEVITESGAWLPHNRLRGPDVLVLATEQDTTWAEEPPLLVVEVLSPSTRTEDTRVKAPEYAAAGVGHLWLVDPRDRCIECFDNVGGTWHPVLRVDGEHPMGEAGVEDDTVVIDLARILRR